MLHLRSDKGLELKTSTLCGGHVSMIISNYLAIAPTDSAPQFFQPTAGFGVIFQRFLHLTGERRQALGELETRVTRERRSAKKFPLLTLRVTRITRSPRACLSLTEKRERITPARQTGVFYPFNTSMSCVVFYLYG